MHILHLKRLPVISSSLGFLSLLEPRSAFPVGMGGKVPPAALSDRTPSVNRAARQYLGISFSPRQHGRTLLCSQGKVSNLEQKPIITSPQIWWVRTDLLLYLIFQGFMAAWLWVCHQICLEYSQPFHFLPLPPSMFSFLTSQFLIGNLDILGILSAL